MNLHNSCSRSGRAWEWDLEENPYLDDEGFYTDDASLEEHEDPALMDEILGRSLILNAEY